MKKIPTLFKREYDGKRVIGITDTVTDGMEWVLDGYGVATIKVDGACCAFIEGVFYKRFDAKPGRKIPDNAIPCCEPDPVTGHWPHWVPVDLESAQDKWFAAAYHDFVLYGCRNLSTLMESSYSYPITLEAIGKHFNGNPYKLDKDILVQHGECHVLDFRKGTSFEQIREFLRTEPVEGLVFWAKGEPKCKIKRSDFGFEWPCEGATYGSAYAYDYAPMSMNKGEEE